MIRTTTLLLAATLFIFNSCTTDIEVNTPALQATIDGDLFRPEIRKAILHDDGTLVISGNTDDKAISFSTSSTEIGTYKMANQQQTIQKVSFQQEGSKFISEEGVSNGEIIITEIYNNEVSGNFYFRNLKSNNGKSMSFQNGWFYRLPIENFVSEDEVEDPENKINPCLLNASLTAKIDGIDMITDDHKAEPFGILPPYPSIRITSSDESQDIEIVFSIDTDPGQYSLTGSGDYSATYSRNNEKSAAISGTLTITEHNKETKCLSGSFEFETASGVKITEGAFDYGY